MMKPKFSVLPVFLLLACLPLLCRVSLAGSQDAGLPGAYLDFAGGARSNAMGRAFVAVAEGSEAVLWNPAGLGYLRPNTINFTHIATVEEFSLDTLFYAQPLFRKGGFGLGYARMSSGSLPMTDELNRKVGSFSDLQQTYMLSYGMPVYTARSAKKSFRTLSAGATLKFSRQELYTASAGGWGLDLGAMARFKRNITAGLRLQNAIAPKLKFETASDTFPRRLTFGAAICMLKDKLTLTTDLEKTLGVEQRLRWSLGAEVVFWDVMKLRGGFDLKNKGFTFGLGYLFGRHEVDYAASSNDIGLSNNLGLIYSFGGFPVSIQAKPEAFSPVGLRKATTFLIRVLADTRIYGWTLYIRDQDGNVARSFRGSGAPPPEIKWDGSTQAGSMVAAGNYIYSLEVTNAYGKKEATPSQIVRVVYGTPMDRMYESTDKAPDKIKW